MSKPSLDYLSRQPYAKRIARVARVSPAAGYLAVSTRLQKVSSTKDAALADVRPILEDGGLTDQGRQPKITEAFKLHLFELGKMEKATLGEKAAREKQRAEKRASNTPQKADLAMLTQVQIGLLLTDGRPADRDRYIASFTELPPDGVPSVENVVALSLHPDAIPGGAGVAKQEILRRKLGITDLGEEGRQLDLEDHIADLELGAIRDLRGALAACCDIENLVATKIIEKPFSLMNSEERVAYARKNGADALHQLAFGDRAIFGEFLAPPEEEPPTPAVPPVPAAA